MIQLKRRSIAQSILVYLDQEKERNFHENNRAERLRQHIKNQIEKDNNKVEDVKVEYTFTPDHPVGDYVEAAILDAPTVVEHYTESEITTAEVPSD